MHSLLTNSFREGVTSPALLYSIIANLTLLYTNKSLELDQITNPNPTPLSPPAEYDYIVVGSGSAGGIVASRLSENSNISVLLLEAGGDALDINEIPFLWMHNLGHKTSDWMYRTVPQKHSAFSYSNNIIPQPRGKSIGGTSNLNAMVYWRGHPKDFDNWANLTQDDGWSYAKLLPFFKKMETYDGSFEKSPRYHGESGPIYVTPQNYKILRDGWIAAGREMGFPSVDPDVDQIPSFVPCDVSGLNGRRVEIKQGYLNEEILKIRKNLHILRYAHVTRINLNGDNNRAEDVTWTRFGQTFSARAKHEVVISAGAYNSPKLLMLSGIGQREHLESLGVINIC